MNKKSSESKNSDDIILNILPQSSKRDKLKSQIGLARKKEFLSDLADQSLPDELHLNGNSKNSSHLNENISKTQKILRSNIHDESRPKCSYIDHTKLSESPHSVQPMEARKLLLNRESELKCSSSDQCNGAQFRNFNSSEYYTNMADDEVGYSDRINNSSHGDSEICSPHNLVDNVGDSDVDNSGPTDNDAVNLSYLLRRNRRRQRMAQRRRDSTSIADNSIEADALCNHRRDESNSRSSRRDPPRGLSRSSSRAGRSVRASSIPPPPTEPPPSTPGTSPMLADMSSVSNHQNFMYPIVGLNIAQQAALSQQMTPRMCGPLLSMNSIGPQMLAGFSQNFLPPDEINNTDASQQFFQMQQQAAFLQQQQQAAAFQQQFAYPVGAGSQYIQGFATVGRPGRSAPLVQPQMCGIQPASASVGNNFQTLQRLGLIPSHAWLQAQPQSGAGISAPIAQLSTGESSSVVYENSFNSIKRLTRQINGTKFLLEEMSS